MYKNFIAMKLPMKIFKKLTASQIFWGISGTLKNLPPFM